MGSSACEWMLRKAARVAEETGSPWPYTQPTWVFSRRRPPTVAGADVRLVQGDVKPVHAELARAAGARNVWVVGGGDLAGQFHDARPLDEAFAQVVSVTLGRGKPLFPRRATSPLWTRCRFGRSARVSPSCNTSCPGLAPRTPTDDRVCSVAPERRNVSLRGVAPLLSAWLIVRCCSSPSRWSGWRRCAGRARDDRRGRPSSRAGNRAHRCGRRPPWWPAHRVATKARRRP